MFFNQSAKMSLSLCALMCGIFAFNTNAAQAASDANSTAVKANKVCTFNAMRKILTASVLYVNDNDGNWPDSLDQVTKYINDPNVNIADFVYKKPAQNAATCDLSKTQMLFQKDKEQFQGGQLVGFADCHVEFVKDNKRSLPPPPHTAVPGPQGTNGFGKNLMRKPPDSSGGQYGLRQENLTINRGAYGAK